MRVAIITPALALRAGFRAMLGPVSPGAGSARDGERIEVVLEAATLHEYARIAPAVDVLLVTAGAARLPDLQDILNDQAQQDDENRPALLVMNDAPDGELALNLQEITRLPVRAWGVLPLDASAEELLAALAALYEGLIVASPALFQSLAAGPLLIAPAGVDALISPLTERESQVLQLVARGMANKQIAGALRISEHTVKFHISSIYNKLGVTSRTEAVRSGVQRGLIYL